MAARANDRETEWCVSGRTVNSYLHKLPRAHAADNAIAEGAPRDGHDGRRSSAPRLARELATRSVGPKLGTEFLTQPLLVELVLCAVSHALRTSLR